jgi:hypothetical protein
MRILTTLSLALIMGVGFVGCDQKAGKKVETTVTTPEGETKKTEEVTVEKSGDHKTEGELKTGTPADPTAPATTPSPTPVDPAPTPNPTPEGK